MNERHDVRRHDAWARLRFSVIGHLLAAPPTAGELRTAIEALAAKEWQHPITRKMKRFGFSTIESWYYRARNETRDPFGKLARRVRSDSGLHRSMSERVCAALRAQYNAHKGWSCQLHHDNLKACAKKDPELEPVPAYSTVRRWMQSQGLLRERHRRVRRNKGMINAEARHDQREVRSYEAEYVNGLWHLDFHHGSRHVLTRDGTWEKPMLLAVIDDRSRLCCHAQWYLSEGVEELVHGTVQAFQKRGLPGELMTDNGSAMRAAEFQAGLLGLSVLHSFTLPYAAYQNAKVECFWPKVEGRLMAMLEGRSELTLALLNEATQPWVEFDYNRKPHSELGVAPMDRWLNDKRAGRECPSSETLRKSFRDDVDRSQRRSDGTIALAGQRFEIPSRYRSLTKIRVRYASWDLGFVHLVDARTGDELCQIYPIDKVKNAEGFRRQREPLGDGSVVPQAPASDIAPLLHQMMADYSATGLPPAYLPKDDVERTPVDADREGRDSNHGEGEGQEVQL